MKKLLILAISSLFLAACGGSGNSSTGLNITEPNLGQISGVWDLTKTYEDGEDKIYLVITDSGELKFYDYFGDSFDQGLNCYFNFNETITDLGNGTFEVSNTSDNEFNTISLAIVNDQLAEISSSSSDYYPEASLSESDFSPLCEELFASISLSKSSISPKQYQFINSK